MTGCNEARELDRPHERTRTRTRSQTPAPTPTPTLTPTRYASWLDHVSACFAHHQGTSCRAHLACLLAEIRGAEYGTSQHTPSLVRAGYVTLRAVRVPNPSLTLTLTLTLTPTLTLIL